MKTIKIISRFILSVTAACCMASCNYLDVVPDETADLPDAMKDRASTLGFLHSCYTYFEWFYTVENSSSTRPMNMPAPYYGLTTDRKRHGTSFLLPVKPPRGIVVTME